MLEVELDIYSGMPNPRWELSPSETRSLMEQIRDRSVPILGVSQLESFLGYAGFIIYASGDHAKSLSAMGIPSVFRIFAGATDLFPRSTVEKELMRQVREEKVAPSRLDQMSTAMADPEIGFSVEENTTSSNPPDQSNDPSFTSAADSTCRLATTSPRDFSFWNGNSETTLFNNCYNYGSNLRTDSRAQPGRQSDTGFGAAVRASNVTVAKIREGALGDGYKNTCSGSRLRVWFAVDPGVDYHWWRLNWTENGVRVWCHKRGSLRVSNKDGNGNLISDPRTSARFGYNVDGSFMFRGPGVRIS